MSILDKPENEILKTYINRHLFVETIINSKHKQILDKIFPYYLLIINKINSNKSQTIINNYIKKIITSIYFDIILSETQVFINDFIKNTLEFETKNYNKTLNNDDEQDILLSLILDTLIINKSLDTWFKLMIYKDYTKIIKIINTYKDNELTEHIINHYKHPKLNSKNILISVAFTGTYIIRNSFLLKNEIELIKWISILDSGTSPMCIKRANKLYYLKDKLPYNHDIKWEIPGVYHWGCRSFVIPYNNKREN